MARRETAAVKAPIEFLVKQTNGTRYAGPVVAGRYQVMEGWVSKAWYIADLGSPSGLYRNQSGHPRFDTKEDAETFLFTLTGENNKAPNTVAPVATCSQINEDEMVKKPKVVEEKRKAPLVKAAAKKVAPVKAAAKKAAPVKAAAKKAAPVKQAAKKPTPAKAAAKKAAPVVKAGGRRFMPLFLEAEKVAAKPVKEMAKKVADKVTAPVKARVARKAAEVLQETLPFVESATKAKAEKPERKPRVGERTQELILEGLSVDQVIERLNVEFPNKANSRSNVNWYRTKLRSEGHNLPRPSRVAAGDTLSA